MCNEKKCCCERPKELKGLPEECSAKQIEACHSDAKGHPCVPQEKHKPTGEK